MANVGERIALADSLNTQLTALVAAALAQFTTRN